jgi:hypothetical protein
MRSQSSSVVSNQTTTQSSSSQRTESQSGLKQLPPEPSDTKDVSIISKLVIRLPGSFFVIIYNPCHISQHIHSELKLSVTESNPIFWFFL